MQSMTLITMRVLSKVQQQAVPKPFRRQFFSTFSPTLLWMWAAAQGHCSKHCEEGVVRFLDLSILRRPFNIAARGTSMFGNLISKGILLQMIGPLMSQSAWKLLSIFQRRFQVAMWPYLPGCQA